MALRAFLKKGLVAVTVTSFVMTTCVRPAFAADPVTPAAATAVTPPQVPTSPGDSLVDLAMSLLSNPISENTLVILLIIALAKSAGFSAAAAKNFPAAVRTYFEKRADFHLADLDYKAFEEEYVQADHKIKKLEGEIAKLKEAFPRLRQAKDHVGEERIRREIERKNVLIAEIKKRNPVLVTLQAVQAMQQAEQTLTGTIEKLPPKANTAIRQWKETHRPDYIGEWLQSDAGKAFLKQEPGKKWHAEYVKHLQGVSDAVDAAIAIRKELALQVNALGKKFEQVDSLRANRSEHGTQSDEFLLVPPRGDREAEYLRRTQLANHINDLCKLHLGRLSRGVKAAQVAAGIYPNFKSQMWSFGSFTATSSALGAYAMHFQNRYKQTFLAARVESRVKDKIVETAKVSIAGQIDGEKNSQNRLAEFHDVGVSALWEKTNRDNLISFMNKRMGIVEKANGKSEFLAKRVEAIESEQQKEKLKLLASFEDAVKKVLQRQGETSLDEVLKQIYTADQNTRTTVLRRRLTLVFRDTIANYFSEIVDEPMLDEIEKAVLPQIVESVLKELPTYEVVLRRVALEAEARRSKPAQGSSASSEGHPHGHQTSSSTPPVAPALGGPAPTALVTPPPSDFPVMPTASSIPLGDPSALLGSMATMGPSSTLGIGPASNP